MMVRRIVLAIVYAAAAAATANWLDIGLWPEQPRYVNRVFEVMIRTALLGSAAFALASLVSLFHLHYGRVVGWVAVGLSLPYFGYLNLFIWFRPPHSEFWGWVGALSWLAAALYSMVEAWRWRRSGKPSAGDSPALSG